MPTIDRTQFEQLILQIEQDMLLQTEHLGALLIAKNPILAAHHREKLQAVSARIKRPRHINGAPPSSGE